MISINMESFQIEYVFHGWHSIPRLFRICSLQLMRENSMEVPIWQDVTTKSILNGKKRVVTLFFFLLMLAAKQVF